MRDYDDVDEKRFFALLAEYYDAERDAGKQHDPAHYTLDRMQPLAALAGHPERSLKVIHVAGTKGKGSTSHYISALLAAAGKRTGLFASPHLVTVRERFLIDNRLISYPLLLQQAETFRQSLHQADLHPSLFELFTVLALKIFRDAGLEYAVMETGIGGRLDATNYIPDPVCTVITPISYDHMALLGHEITQIASEKGGIIKPGVPLVLAPQPFAAAEATLLDIASRRQAPLFRPLPETDMTVSPLPEVPFLRDNLLVAGRVLRVLGLQPQADAFHFPELRGRCETIRREPLVILDAAHNADSARRLAEAITLLHPGLDFTIVLGIVKLKDVEGIVRELRQVPGDFILTHPDTGKGSALPELEAAMAAAGLPVRAVIPRLTERSQLPAGRPLLFTGSFFTALLGEKLFNP